MDGVELLKVNFPLTQLNRSANPLKSKFQMIAR